MTFSRNSFDTAFSLCISFSQSDDYAGFLIGNLSSATAFACIHVITHTKKLIKIIHYIY